MNDELKLKHNEMRKLHERNKCLLFIFDLVFRARGSNFTSSSLTFQKDKMNLVANMNFMNFSSQNPTKD